MSRIHVPSFKDEGCVKREIKKVLKRYRLHWWMPGASQFGTSGTHDFCIVQCGLFWTVEAKFGYNKPSENQVTFAESVQRNGGLSLCINEVNIWEVGMAADYIAAVGRIPQHMNHDFAALTRRKKPK